MEENDPDDLPGGAGIDAARPSVVLDEAPAVDFAGPPIEPEAATTQEAQPLQAENINIEEEPKKDEDKKSDTYSVESDKVLTNEEILKEYLPWLVAAGFGFVLLIIAVAMLLTAGGTPFIFPYKPETFTMPNYQGSLRIYSVDDEPLRYTNDLRYIGSSKSTDLRYKIEPKLISLYGEAGLSVDNVVVLSFKYGGAGEVMKVANGRLRVQGRSGEEEQEKKKAIVVRHWVYLKENSTIAIDKLKENIISSLSKVPSLDVDANAVSIASLENMTQLEAIKLLAQAGFFANGLKGIDMALLDLFGLSPFIGIQSDDDGLCVSLRAPENGHLFPAACKKSIDTYVLMTCQYVCDAGFEMRGSATRVCLSSGLWSGSPAKCLRKCPVLKLQSAGSLQPPTCSAEQSSPGQLCFFECPSNTHKMVFPENSQLEPEAVDLKAWPSRQYFSLVEAKESNASIALNVGGYFRECLPSGEWSGGEASCKALCASIEPPLNGQVSPRHCRFDPVEGDTCTVTCDEGYVMNGGGKMQILSCDVGGIWTKDVPVCKKTCVALTTPSKLIMQIKPELCLSFPYEGTKCFYSCNTKTGYVLRGEKSRTCSDGEWDVAEPECVTRCPSQRDPAHGFLVSKRGPCSEQVVTEGTTCNVVCDFGFIPGVLSSRCQSSATWTKAQSDINCRVGCPSLGPDEYGTWSPPTCMTPNHFSHLGICRLACDGGSSAVGETSVTCKSDGMWDKVPGKCTVSCPALTAPPNGQVEDDVACTGATAWANKTCHYSCDPGYKLVGDRSQTCNSTHWSGTPPTCTSETQYHVGYFNGGLRFCLAITEDGALTKVHTDIECLEESGRWTFVSRALKNVRSGLCLTGNLTAGLLKMATCGGSNQEIETVAEFILRIKGTDWLLTSGHRTGSRPYLMKTSWYRDESLYWSFIAAAPTLAPGTWQTLYGLNNGNKCPPIPFPSGSSFSSGLPCFSSAKLPATKCSLSCDYRSPDISDVFDFELTCHNGAWEYYAYVDDCMVYKSTCSAVTTDASWGVTVEPSGCTSGTHDIGTICTFKCDSDDKSIDGASITKCVESGRWSHEAAAPPVCKKRCPDIIPLPNNTHLVAADASMCRSADDLKPPIGTACPLACEPGYELDGHPIPTCAENGLWSDELPHCVKTCSDLGDVPHLQLTSCSKRTRSGSYLPDATCRAVCDGQYHLTAKSPFLTCEESGLWSTDAQDETFECLPKCPTPELTENMTVVPESCANETSLAGAKCTFSCDIGYGLDKAFEAEETFTGLVRECAEDMKWSGPAIVCTRRCRALPVIDVGNSGYYNPHECNSGKPVKPGTRCELLCQGDDAVYGGPDAVICGDDGQWSPEEGLGVCSPACEALPLRSHSIIYPQVCLEGFVQAGTECVITCPDYMERIGSGLRVCHGVPNVITGARWSGLRDPTYCKSRCPPLKASANIYVFPPDCLHNTKIENDMCAFECNPGYTLRGTASLLCMSGGYWHADVPTCYRPCPPVKVMNGKLFCNELFGFPSESIGLVYGPGTKCHFTCNEGYTAYDENQIICDEDGIWSPTPYCSPIADAFPIVQKIGEESVCLEASHSGMDGSDGKPVWHVTVTKNSTTGCERAANNGMWFWLSAHNIKHAETGLCLAAESKLSDAGILLQRCDTTNTLQHWDCDPSHPYRFILKNTDLSIDTVYKNLGPVLQSWTHAETYWITFNSILETTGTVCSNKALGSCPPINVPGMKVLPDVCSTDEVTMWQRCAVFCEEGAEFSGEQNTTECQATGEWDGLDSMHCWRNCPRLPDILNGTYDGSSCTAGNSTHSTVCYLTCEKGFGLSHGQLSQSYTCADGEWVGDMQKLTCEPRCEDQPYAPEDGELHCEDQICKIVCDDGYVVNGNSSAFFCHAGVDYLEVNNITCQEEFQFRLQSEFSVFSANKTTCLVAYGRNVLKAECDYMSQSQYWRWEDSADLIEEDFSMLQNTKSGLCLTAEIGDVFNISNISNVTNATDAMGHPIQVLYLAECNTTDKYQQWTCHRHHRPGRFGLVSEPMSYVDIGDITPGSTAVLRSDNMQVKSGDWIAMGKNGVSKYTCASRRVGSCPKLTIGNLTSVEPPGCALWDGLPVGSVCTVSCEVAHTKLSGSDETTHEMTCQASGAWDKDMAHCISEKLGYCAISAPSEGLIISPNCLMPTVPLGSACRFSCGPGYFLDGHEEMICNGEENWEIPVCRAYCPGLANVPGIDVTGEFCEMVQVPLGTQCERTCSVGYLPSAESNVNGSAVCLHDGTWSEDFFYCDEACPPLSLGPYNATDSADDIGLNGTYRRVVTSTSCANEGTPQKGKCVFSCQAGNITVGGPSEVTCGRNGKWSDDIPWCVSEYLCPEPDATDLIADYDNLLGGKAVGAGTLLKMRCSQPALGYSYPVGDDVRVCLENGTWAGNGPEVPGCERQCAALIPPFGGDIVPRICQTGLVAWDTACYYTCSRDTVMNPALHIISTTCQGNWSEASPRCYVTDPAKVDDLGVFEREDAFLMITRAPYRGCLYAAPDGVVRWRPAEECDPRQSANKWRWYDSQRIMSLSGKRCIEPFNATEANTTLIVGTCNTTEIFGCTNPRSSRQRFRLLSYSDPAWRLDLVNDIRTGKPSHIAMFTMRESIPVLPKDAVDGLLIYANNDVMSPRTSDKTVCSYQCGGWIIFDKGDPRYRFTSPGLIHNQSYPANAYCEWHIYGHGRVVNLYLEELDLDDEIPENKCGGDCIQIFEGGPLKTSKMELLAEYAGKDIYSQSPLHVRSISSQLKVVFTANGFNQGRGFSIEYKFKDKPVPRQECGSRDNYDVKAQTGIPVPEPGRRGAPTTIEKWPWLVSIRQRYKGSSKAYHRCTGALIGEDVVVSAAHCVRFTQEEERSTVDIGIGHSLQNDMDKTMRENKTDETEPMFYVYHEYDYVTRHGDIALWKLDHPVELNDKVQPACIPDAGYRIRVTTPVCFTAGWSSLAQGVKLNQIYEYEVNMVATSWCEQSLGLARGSGFACAENNNFDISGEYERTNSEPLMCKYNGNWFLSGVRSHTRVSVTKSYRLYTELHSYSRWITHSLETMRLYDSSQGGHLLVD